MDIPCDTCNGDGFVSWGDRHTETAKEVCPKCKGHMTIPSRTGEVPEASASPDGLELYAHRVSMPKGESFVMEVLDVPRTTLEADDTHQGGKAPSLREMGQRMPNMTAQQAADKWHGINVIDDPVLSLKSKLAPEDSYEPKPTRLKQLYRHKPEEGVYGDCQRTCLAMMLGFSSPEYVPHFGSDGPPDGVFWDRVHAWLGEMGYKIFQNFYDGEQASLSQVLLTQGQCNPGIYYMLAGRSRNDSDHVVVCLGDAVWADPAIDNSGIVGPGTDGYYRVEVLVPTRMTEFRRPRGHEDLPETPGPV